MASKKLQIIIDAQNNATREFKKLETQVKKTSRVFSSEMKLVKRATQGLAVGLGAVAAGLAYTGKQALDNASDFEQNRIAFEAMFKSADKASKLMEDIVRSAKKTPFELKDLVKGAKSLAAYKVQAEDIVPVMEMLGDISATVGTDKLPVLIRAFGQVKAKTKLMGQELLQMTDTGIPIVEELSKVTGHSVEEIANNTGRLGITFADVQKALLNMTKEGGIAYKGMEVQSKTLAGVISNLKDNFTILGMEIVGVSKTGEIIKDGLYDKIKQGAEIALQWIDKNKEAIKKFASEAVQSAINKVREWYESIGGAEGLKTKLTNLWNTLKNEVIPTVKVFIGVIGKVIAFIIKHRDELAKLYLAYLTIKTVLVAQGVISTLLKFARTIKIVATAGWALRASFGWIGIVATAIAIIWKINKAMDNWGGKMKYVRRMIMSLFGPIGTAIDMFRNWKEYVDELRWALGKIKEGWNYAKEGWNVMKEKFSKRATGGSVTSGKPYIVGERGAEVFVPATSGRIEKNIEMQPAFARGTINVSVNGGVYLDRNAGEQLAEAISDTLRNKLRL